MRFDRRHVQGPDAGFLGAEITVSEFTGSVERSLTQTAGVYHYDTVPFAGYPITAGQMSIACGGKGIWIDGYLCDEPDSGITSSFNSSNTMGQTGTGVSYRLVGFRGPADDYAVGFSTASAGGLQAASSASYALASGSDLAILWVAQASAINEELVVRRMFSKLDSNVPISGYSLTTTTFSSSPPGINTQLDISDGVVNPQINLTLPLGQWYAALFCVERGAISASYSCLNLETDAFTTSRIGLPYTGSQDGRDIHFSLGNKGDVFKPPSMTMSAIYFASGTNATSGFILNEEGILRSFARVIRARNGYLFSGSAEIDRSLATFGNAPESAYVTQQLLGLSTASLGRSRGVTIITTGSIPSWTNVHIRNSAFVSTPLSSSDHEAQSLNYFRSGSSAIETTAVPASATLYYSKKSFYQTLSVKKTASFFDTVVPFSGAIVPSQFSAGTGSLITIVTGSNMHSMSASFRYPATIRVDVPQSGKLVDLKVWVELTHHSSSAGQADPLGTLGIAIKSPNLRWGGHAHPIRNDPKFITAFKNPLFVQASILGSTGVDDIYIPPARFFSDTFLLWEGYAIENYNGTEKYPGPASNVTAFYPSWNRDRHMRTVFSDGSPIANPRHLTGPVSGNYNGSPNGASAWGNNAPWTTEAFGFSGEPITFQAAGSPPKGWLTGPGGVANTNEWPTTGSNLGAETVRPVYPLLDGIYQRKRVGSEFPLIGTIVTKYGGTVDIPQENPGLWRGFRPGLRGTEISGTWEIMFAQCGDISGSGYEIGETERINSYFRQVRFEFTYELHEDPTDIRSPQLGKPHRLGESLHSSISGSGQMGRDDGSGSWDGYVSDTYIDYRGSAETGRTFGVGLNTGSVDFNQYALIYRITGTLADLSGTTPGWLLNNRFNMPWIPISSASLVEADVSPVVSIHPQDILTDKPIVDSAARVTEAVQTSNPPLTRAEVYEATLISLNKEEE
jgi:hypothetical protein